MNSWLSGQVFLTQGDDGIFAAPMWLWGLVLVPLVAGVLFVRGRVHLNKLRRLYAGDALSHVLPASVRTRRTIRDVLRTFALVFGVLALAGPRCDKQIELVDARGVDLVLVVDLSRSMDAMDVQPSRLEQVRREVADLLEEIEGDRVGLVTFAGAAFPRMPLSEDTALLSILMEEMSTKDFQSQGSALHEALMMGAQMLGSDESAVNGRAMIVFSDGEMHDPVRVLEAARTVREDGHRVFTVGVGESPAPIPLGQGLWQYDRAGRQVLSNPSPEFLRELAKIGGGAFTKSEPSNADMSRLYHQEIRTLLNARVRQSKPRITWKEMWPYPMGFAVICFLLGGWIGEGRRGALAVMVLFLSFVGLAVPAPAEAASVAEADAMYRSGKFQEAARTLSELAREHPGDVDVLRRLGSARYRAGDYEGAYRAWREASERGRDGVESDFELGNAAARSGKLDAALRHYDEALRQDETHPGAKANRAWVEEEIARRLAAEPPPPEQEESKESSEENEEQSKENQQGEPSDDGQDQGQQDEQGEESGEEEEQSESDSKGESENDQEAEGSADGPREQSDRDQTGENTNPPESQGEKPIDPNGERGDAEDTPTASQDELGEGDPSLAAEGGTDPEPLSPEEQAAARAEAELEAVKEGRPRLTIPGGSGEKPW